MTTATTKGRQMIQLQAMDCALTLWMASAAAVVAASAVALNQSASRLSHSTMTSETVDQRALLEVMEA